MRLTLVALIMLFSLPATNAMAESLDECAAALREKIGHGRGTLRDWYPVCKKMKAEERRRSAAEEEQRAAGATDPAVAAEKQIRLENCLNLPNPSWNGKKVSRAWWEAHCRWYTGQPGAERPPEP